MYNALNYHLGPLTCLDCRKVHNLLTEVLENGYVNQTVDGEEFDGRCHGCGSEKLFNFKEE